MATSKKIYSKQVTFDVCLPFYYSDINDNESKSNKLDESDKNEFCFKSSLVKLHPFEFSLEVHPRGYGEENSDYVSVFLVSTITPPPVPKDLSDYRVSYCISLLSIDEKDNERLPKKGYTSHGFRQQNSWGYRRFLPCDVLYNRKFISDDSLLKFRVTVRIEVDDYDFDRYTTKENEDDFIIVNDFVPINSSDGTGLG